MSSRIDRKRQGCFDVPKSCCRGSFALHRQLWCSNPFYELAEHTNVSRSSNAGLKPKTANRHTGAVAITISRAKIKQTRGAGTVIGLTMRLVIRAVRLGVTSLP